MQETGYGLIRKGIRVLDGTINLVVLLLFLLCLSIGGYALWDSNQIYQEANQQHYEQYKPTADDSLSFQELQQINPDAFGWLTIYGTNIDYPLVQGESNDTYLNTSVTGENVLSGSIFLDCRNQRDFSDFNSIIYGHHMDKQVMFGELDQFVDDTFFAEHQYGELYYNGAVHGLEFFAFLETDAYNSKIYSPAVAEAEDQEEYISSLWQQASQLREISVLPSDHIVLLSTCASLETNGRYILVGKISTTVYDNPFYEDEVTGEGVDWLSRIPVWLLVVMFLLAAGVFLIIIKRRKRSKRNEGSKNRTQEKEK
ncbi:MAG: class B sortase [Lachnospiraceae bacterium]